MRPRDLAALILLGAIWGSSFLFIRIAVPALGPFGLIEVRVALAATALTLYAVALRRTPKLRYRWRQFLVLGTFNAAIPFSSIAAAEIHLTASLAAILNSTTVLFTALVAAAWIGEALTTRKVVGIVVGIVGVAVLVGWDPIHLNTITLLSVGASLVASLSYATGGVYVKRAFTDVPPLTMSIGQQAAAAVVLLPLAALTVPEKAPSPAVAVSAVALALMCTAIAYLIYFRLITNVGPTRTLTVTFLSPAFGVLFGVLILDEPFGLGTLAGLGIILVSVALVTGIRIGRTKDKAIF